MVLLDDTVRHIVNSLDGDGIVQLYCSVASSEAKRAVLRSLGDVPSPAVEALLLEALEHDDLFAAACAGLTRLRSPRAGPPLLGRLPKLDGDARRLVIRALGRIHYRPALDALLNLLKTAYGNLEYALVKAVGAIGGKEAYDAVASRFGGDLSEVVLALLLDAHDAHATRLLHELLELHPEAKSMLANALSRRKWLQNDTVYPDDSYAPEFDDSALLRALIDAAESHLARPFPTGLIDMELHSDCKAIALFDTPEATAFLQKVAARATGGDRLKIPSDFARRLLARRGDRRWGDVILARELDSLAEHPSYTSHVESELKKWPEDAVRNALLSRIAEGGDRLGSWLHLLLFVATKDDENVLRKHLDHVDADTGDLIRQHLSMPDSSE